MPVHDHDDPFSNNVRTVLFGRGSLNPSQYSRDWGWGIASPLLAFPVAAGFAFLVLNLAPVLRDGLSTMDHLRVLLHAALGMAGMGNPDMVPLWRDAVSALPLPARAFLGLKVALSGLAGAWVAWMAHKSALLPVNGYVHTGGVRLLCGEEALAAAKARAAREIDRSGKNALLQADYKIHPDFAFTKARWGKMMMVIGKIGGGKGVVLLEVAAQAIGAGDKILIHDVKGEYLSVFYKEDADGNALPGNPVALLAPWDGRSLIWDIQADIDTEQAAQELAGRLIEASKDPMWSGLATMIFVACCVKLQTDRAIHGREWGFPELAALLSADPVGILEPMMMEYYPEGMAAITGSENTVASVIATMTAGVKPIAQLAMAWPRRIPGRMFSIVDWLKKDKVDHPALILGGNGKYGQLQKSLVSTLVSLAAQTINSPELPDSRTRRVTLLLDEFPRMGKIDVEPIVAVGRSKGIRTIVAVQDISQLKEVLGEGSSSALKAMVSTTLCMGVGAGASSEEIAGWADKEILERSNVSTSGGQGTSHSWQSETRQVILPSQIQALGEVPGVGCRGLMLGFGGNPLVVLWPFGAHRAQTAQTVRLAEWTKPGASSILGIRLREERVRAMLEWEDERRRLKGATGLPAGVDPLGLHDGSLSDDERERSAPTIVRPADRGAGRRDPRPEAPAFKAVRPQDVWADPANVARLMDTRGFAKPGQDYRDTAEYKEVFEAIKREERDLEALAKARAAGGGSTGGGDPWAAGGDGIPDGAEGKRLGRTPGPGSQVPPQVVARAAAAAAQGKDSPDAGGGWDGLADHGAAAPWDDEDGEGDDGAGGFPTPPPEGAMPAAEPDEASEAKKAELVRRMREREAREPREGADRRRGDRRSMIQDAPVVERRVVGPAGSGRRGGAGADESEGLLHAAGEAGGGPALDGGVGGLAAEGVGDLLGPAGAEAIAGLFKILIETEGPAPRRVVENGTVVELTERIPPPREG